MREQEPRTFVITKIEYKPGVEVGARVLVSKQEIGGSTPPGKGSMLIKIRPLRKDERFDVEGQRVGRSRQIEGTWKDGRPFILELKEGEQGRTRLQCRIGNSRPESDSWTADEDGP